MSARAAATSRVIAAVLGALAVTIAACVCLALAISERGRGVALGALLGVPVWVGLMTVGFVARSATRLWLSYLAGAAALSALSLLIR